MNKVMLIGNLTRDPELSQTSGGTSRCNFGIAVNRTFANQQGEKEVDFFNITTWAGLAENCAKYLRKGKKVGIVGRLQVRNYEVDGQKRTAVDVVAEDVEFLSPRDSVESDDYDNAGSGNYNSGAKKRVNELTQIEDDKLPF